MTVFNRRQLEKVHVLLVNDISFASDAIGAASGVGRAAETDWIATDNVVFKGPLKDILIFALMAFSGSSVSVAENFEIVPIEKWVDVPNLTSTDIVTAISLDPADGEGIVLANDVTFLTNLTNNFRLAPSTVKRVIVEEKADASNKILYQGSVLEALAYALQYQDQGTAPIYTLFEVALMDAGGMNVGVIYDPISGANGPVEYEPYLLKIANAVLSVQGG
jgi:hypothetical protein